MSSQIALIMGSKSDWPVMGDAYTTCRDLGVSCDPRVISAHRTPQIMLEFAQSAREVGYKIIIAGAGGAAHLPGMVASATPLPVIGVPVSLSVLDGLDSLLSIVQMPSGVPVATVGINNARNAALLAARILSLYDTELSARLDAFIEAQMAASRDARIPDIDKT